MLVPSWRRSEGHSTRYERRTGSNAVPNRGCRLQGNDSKTSSASRAGAFWSFLRRPAAWKLASELASLVTAPERTETAGAFQHVSAAAQAERRVLADAGSR